MRNTKVTRIVSTSSAPLAVLFLAAASALAQTAPATPPPDAPTPAGQQSQRPASPTAELPDSPGAAIPQHVDIQPTGPLAVFDTTMGRLTCRLFDKQSPVATANFVGLANGSKDWTDPNTSQKVHGQRFYDGTPFHRVIPGFMIQGGDRKGDGSGDAGYYFDNENTPGLDFSVAGRLAMANAGPNTNGTQFFITEVPYPDLDGKYTIFGQCDSHSVLMVASIARVDRNSSDKPLTPVILNKLTIVPEGGALPPLPPAPADGGTAPAAPNVGPPVAPMPSPK